MEEKKLARAIFGMAIHVRVNSLHVVFVIFLAKIQERIFQQNKYRDRCRSRDRSPSSIDRFDSRSRDRSPSSNDRFGNRGRTYRTYYKDRGNKGSPNSKSFYVESVENKLNQAQNELAMYKNSPIHNFNTMQSFVPMQNFHTVQQPSPVQMFPYSSYQQPFGHMSQPSDNLRPGTPSIQK